MSSNPIRKGCHVGSLKGCPPHYHPIWRFWCRLAVQCEVQLYHIPCPRRILLHRRAWFLIQWPCRRSLLMKAFHRHVCSQSETGKQYCAGKNGGGAAPEWLLIIFGRTFGRFLWKQRMVWIGYCNPDALKILLYPDCSWILRCCTWIPNIGGSFFESSVNDPGLVIQHMGHPSRCRT